MRTPSSHATKFLASLAAFCLVGILASAARGEDWYSWRGPEQTGVSREVDLPERWSPDPNAPDNNLIWKAPYGGRSTPIVMNGRVYLINSAGEGVNEQERVICFDANTGKLLWEHKFNVFLTDIVSIRLGWTNLAGDPTTGNIYAHGTQGLFFCFDRDGKILWSRSLTEEYGRISGYGGRVTSPVIAGNLVIVGMLNASWGELARGGNRFLAMDKHTGAVVWWGSTGLPPRDTYYSVPVIAEINGERLVISGGGDGGVHAFKANTGEKVWSYVFGEGAINCSPVVHGSRVYVGHGEENPDTNKQGRVICLDAAQVTNGKPKLVWEKAGIKVKYCSPVLHEDRLYVCDEGAQMYCLDASKGTQLWRFKYGRNAKGSPVWADGKIYIGEVNAKFHILKPGPKKCEELHVQYFPSPDGVSDVEINGSPAVANGRVYFMTRDELYCIGKKDRTAPEAAPVPPMPPNDERAASDAKPTHLQVVPADVVLHPGESAKFTARMFDDHGNWVRDVAAKWSAAPMLPPPPPPGVARPTAESSAPARSSIQRVSPSGVGSRGSTPAAATPPAPPPLQAEMSQDGTLTIAEAPPGQFGGVVAEFKGLTARARVRVAPVLPYRNDFEKVPEGRTPGGWVNCQGKFAVREKDGSKVLVKLAENASPLVARSHAYIGMPTLKDYTIQVDVQGGKQRDDMPDMGVVASRYTFFLDGNKQRLRLVSWDAVPRVDKSIDWPWKPGVWYRMKLTVDQQGDHAVARGKIWERAEQEPDAWTIEFSDPTPNREGSPALYGYATGILENQRGAEIYYDNLIVTPNKQAGHRTEGRR